MSKKVKLEDASENKSKDKKPRTVDDCLANIHKKYGKEAIRKYSSKDIIKVDTISTGSYMLDAATYIGGVPRGRIVEFLGPEMSGKTTLALQVAACAQKNELVVAFIDAEHALSIPLCKNLDVAVDDLIVSQPDYGEQALEIAQMLVESNSIGLVIIDSVSALVPQAELLGEMGDSVTYETPVYIRNIYNKYIDITAVGELYKGNKIFTPGRHAFWYKKFKETEILTHNGWEIIRGVVKKENINKKPIVCTRTATGYAQTTSDHSLFMNNEEKRTSELNVFDRLDIYNDLVKINKKLLFNEEVAWLMGFWVAEGSTPRSFNCNRFEVCNTQKALIKRCERIIKKYFICRTEIRERENDDPRKPLYILSCTASNELGFLMRECITEQALIKKVPKNILNGKIRIKKAFLEGFWEGDGSCRNTKLISKPKNYYNNSLLVIAGIQYLNYCLDIRTNVSVRPNKPEQITLTENTGKITRKENEILQFYELPAPEYLYDVSTPSGTFVTAIGNIICHNSHMGLQARLMSQAMRKLTAVVARSNTCIIFINQIRQKIGVTWGSNETTSGGNALKFYSSMRFDIRAIGKLKKGNDIIGNRVRIKVIKNKLSPPFKEVETDLIFGQGINKEGELVDMAVEHNIIEKAGSWYSYKDDRIGQGREAACEWLKSNQDIAEKILTELRVEHDKAI